VTRTPTRLLAVDVGNTNTVIGLYEGESLRRHWRLTTRRDATSDEIALFVRGLLGSAALAGYYVARELGYYKEQCLDVTIQPGGLNIEPEEVVGRGGAQFGIAWQPSMLAARDRGVQLQAIAQVFQYSGRRLISWKESNIRRAKDLKGKTVAVWFAGNELELLATLAK
jgi:NitT/TauT family transport system substrate-binding protein